MLNNYFHFFLRNGLIIFVMNREMVYYSKSVTHWYNLFSFTG